MAATGKRTGKVAGASDGYVALLRGINVGGKNKVPMPALVELFEAAGCRDVRSYIQSGNVLYRAPARIAGQLAARMPRLIGERFGFEVPVIVRRADELAAVARSNPYLRGTVAAADLSILMVMFLADEPTAARVAALDPERSPPDEFVVRGREIYLRCPNTFAKTKLGTSFFDARLATVSTGRNWRTVLALNELLQG